MMVPSKKTLVTVAAVSFVVFALALWRYLSGASDGPGATIALIIWAAALLVCFESIILMRQAQRPFQMGVYTFALIYAALVVVLHWMRGGLG